MDGNSLTTGGKSLQFFPELDSDCSSSQNGIFHRRVWIFYVCKRTNEFLPSPWNKKRKKKEKETSPVPANQFGKRSFVFSFLFFFLSFLLSLEKNPLTPQKDFLIYLRKFTCEIISQFSWRRKIGARRTELSNAVAEIKISKGRREQRASIEKKKGKRKKKKKEKEKWTNRPRISDRRACKPVQDCGINFSRTRYSTSLARSRRRERLWNSTSWILE